MAFNPAPAQWIANWSEDATNITVPIASFAELTAAEADAATGDIRKVVFAIMDCLADKWYSLAAADRPAKMTISRNTSTNETTGVARKTYTVVLETSVSAQEVVAES